MRNRFLPCSRRHDDYANRTRDSYKGKLVQYAGRILRPYDGKTTAEVHDYVDELTGVLASSLAKRAPKTADLVGDAIYLLTCKAATLPRARTAQADGRSRSISSGTEGGVSYSFTGCLPFLRGPTVRRRAQFRTARARAPSCVWRCLGWG